MPIPPEHQIVCSTCGRTIDKRDLGQVLSHGEFNDMTGLFECRDNDMDVPYMSSRRVGDSVEWTKDKKPNYLN